MACIGGLIVGLYVGDGFTVTDSVVVFSVVVVVSGSGGYAENRKTLFW